MKNNRAFLKMLSLSLLLVTVSLAADLKIGQVMASFSLPDTSGTVRKFDDLKGKKGTVVVFLSTQCPVVRGYNDRMNEMAAAYQAKGISFIGVNSNASESAEVIRQHAAEHYKFPVLIDKGNVLADKLGATATPETYFVGPDGKLAYHGAIDNDRSGSNVTENYLQDAFDASLVGKPVEKTESRAFGCSIKRVGDGN